MTDANPLAELYLQNLLYSNVGGSSHTDFYLTVFAKTLIWQNFLFRFVLKTVVNQVSIYQKASFIIYIICIYIYVFQFTIYNFATIKIENACFFSATDTKEYQLSSCSFSCKIYPIVTFSSAIKSATLSIILRFCYLHKIIPCFFS